METGLHHFQGYLELDRAQRITYVKKFDGFEGAHLEPRRGSRDEARAYAMKVDDPTYVEGPWEYGVWDTHEPGKRTDVKEMYDWIKENSATPYEVMDKFPELYCKYPRAIKDFCTAHMAKKQRTTKSKVTLIIGPPNVGKSYYCKDKYPDAFWLTPSKDRVWWDGYDKQEVVILDEFNYGWLPFDFLKRLLDAYPITVEVKGDTRSMVAKEIVITCNKDPRVWYKDHDKFDDVALLRRIDKFIVMKARDEQEVFDGYQAYVTKYWNPTNIYYGN